MAYTRDQIVAIITQEAQQLGIPAEWALAIANQESGLNPNAVGDGGHSIGLFQLNDRGEGAGMSAQLREDPATNARIALTQVANVMREHSDWSPGEIAAAAQRPADRKGYAQKINEALGQGGFFGSIANLANQAASAASGTIRGAAQQAGALQASYGNIDGFLQSQAPELAQAMNDPHVQDLLRQWGAGQLSDVQFQNDLEASDWWKRTSQSERQDLILKATDPGTAAQNLNNMVANVNTLAAKMGVGLPQGVAQQIATHVITDNWGTDQVNQELAKYARYQGDITYKGEAATDVNALRGLYQQMALPADNNTLNTQLQDVLGGKLTVQDIQDQLAQQAATFYAANPQLAEFLKGGQGTARQWASPLITQASNLLGVDPNSIDLTNSQWSFLLKPQVDPRTGQSTGQAQTLDSVEAKIKTDPVYQYSKTSNGINDYQHLVDTLQQTFTGGRVA